MKNNFIIVIPARFGSLRLPGKVLMNIAGKSMLQHVYERAIQTEASKVIIATEDEKVFSHAEEFGAEVYMTSAKHQSGTERIAEIIQILNLDPNQIIVNVQGDKPLVSLNNINQIARNLDDHEEAAVSTLAVPLTEEQKILSTSHVKVVVDRFDYALYFSRSLIPWYDAMKPTPNFLLEHLGLYAYSAKTITEYVQLELSPLEQVESLEQLRLLWHGKKIHVAEAIDAFDPSVDTQKDYEFILNYMKETQELS